MEITLSHVLICLLYSNSLNLRDFYLVLFVRIKREREAPVSGHKNQKKIFRMREIALCLKHHLQDKFFINKSAKKRLSQKNSMAAVGSE